MNPASCHPTIERTKFMKEQHNRHAQQYAERMEI